MPDKSVSKKLNWGTWASVGLLAVIVVAAVVRPGSLEQVQLIIDDYKFISRGVRDPGNEVVIVAIDDKSLGELGRWPFSRAIHARFLKKLSEYKVKVAGLDIFFPEPEITGEKKQLEELQKKAKKMKVTSRAFIQTLKEMQREQDHDAKFASAILSFGRAVLPIVFTPSKGGGELPENSANIVEDLRDYEYLAAIKSSGVLTSLKKLNLAAANLGFIDMFHDKDGVYRWAPCYIRHTNGHYLHLALQLARLYMDLGMKDIAIVGGESVLFGDHVIPTDQNGRMYINYCGPQGTFTTYSYVDVFSGKTPKKDLQGKIVLVGVTATGVYDLRLTPFDKVFPGVEIHANIIENVLHDKFISHVTYFVNVLIIILAGILMIVVLPRLKPIMGLLFALALIALQVITSFRLFSKASLVINDIYPLSAILLIYITITVYKFMGEEAEKRQVKEVFQRFVTKSVMEEILLNPEDLHLGGAEKDLTVLFSDIRSFTAYSEKYTPRQVVEVLNEYLTEMTETVFETAGTLDKYVGDEIMAFWGAPLDQDDHARRACKTALDMMDRLQNKLYDKWRKENKEVFDIGIGVNTGEMLVGYMGSQSRMDYTLIGDNVNLGARLEGTNKQYKSNIIISESTYKAAGNEFSVRELDLIRVKGKKEPVRIFELLAEGELEGVMVEVKGIYGEGLEFYRAQKWDDAIKKFQEVLKLREKDGPSKSFVTRCQLLKDESPGKNWDGVYEMTTK